MTDFVEEEASRATASSVNVEAPQIVLARRKWKTERRLRTIFFPAPATKRENESIPHKYSFLIRIRNDNSTIWLSFLPPTPYP
ncbi:hypothetical protein, partial [Acetobacter sp.]|uniref:hypothetical protein n=1 Tax=Acetobacter sp. TaxID=440 RepID=UPI0039E8C673